MTINSILAICITFASLWFFFHKRIRDSRLWHATVTPLASIIGSGFLVSAPLLYQTSGHFAPLIMLVIVIFAYALGASLRFNILHVEPLLIQNKAQAPWVHRLETLSHPVLGIAYTISVAFYLKLLAAFALRDFGAGGAVIEKLFTTAVLLFIGLTGKRRGLSMLELLETYSVNTKLAIICALIVTLLVYNSELLLTGSWEITFQINQSVWHNFRQILGMLIIIQGFETSRFLGHAYCASERVQTMRYAQWISALIYVLFVCVAMVIFSDLQNFSETAVINICRVAAPVLPYLLIVAAVMSQFSAAVADTIGGAGLLTESTKRKMTVNNSYLLMALFAITLTWLTNIYQIIAIASKAFAVYYAMQCLLSLMVIKRHDFARLCLFACVLTVLLMVIFLGIPVE